MASEFGGLERDLARVRAVANSTRRCNPGCAQPGSGCGAVVSDARGVTKIKLVDAATAAIEELGRKYPKSRWRLQAIIAQANSI